MIPYLNLSDQDVCDAAQYSHKVKHIPRSLQVVLPTREENV